MKNISTTKQIKRQNLLNAKPKKISYQHFKETKPFSIYKSEIVFFSNNSPSQFKKGLSTVKVN